MVCEQTRIRPAASWVAVRSAPSPADSPAPSGGPGDEDHVDVAGVVELAPAALAHGDHRQPARGSAGRQLRAGDGERRLQDGGGQVGEFGGGLVEGDLAGEIAGRQVQEPLPVGHPQRGRRVGVPPGLAVTGRAGAPGAAEPAAGLAWRRGRPRRR